ncbi:MAG: hypothetical protein Q8Q60_03865, partial [Candidatus Chromulinivorax sp.]|nr:hypothetical protein [Candidatus Chromulinivorax sp.]
LAARLFEARYNKKISLLNAIAHQLPELREINKAKHDQVMAMLSELSQADENCLNIKEQNRILKELCASNVICIQQSNESGRGKSATTIQSFFRRYQAQKEKMQITTELNAEWEHFVDRTISGSPAMKTYLLSLSHIERLSFVQWKEYVINKHTEETVVRLKGSDENI